MAWLEATTINRTIALLNELVDTDREAVTVLVNRCTPCNSMVAQHPTIQVGERSFDSIRKWKSDKDYCVGVLGVLNGLFGVDHRGYGPIAAVTNRRGEVVRFQRSDIKDGGVNS